MNKDRNSYAEYVGAVNLIPYLPDGVYFHVESRVVDLGPGVVWLYVQSPTVEQLESMEKSCRIIVEKEYAGEVMRDRFDASWFGRPIYFYAVNDPTARDWLRAHEKPAAPPKPPSYDEKGWLELE